MQRRVESALVRARRRWQGVAAVAGSESVKQKVVGSGSLDAIARRTAIRKGPGRLVQMVQEMEAAGLSLDQQDAALIDYVRGKVPSIATLQSNSTAPFQPKPAA